MVKTQQRTDSNEDSRPSNGSNGSGIKPLMSVRPVLPPEAARHLFAHDGFDYGMAGPPMFPVPHGGMCLPPVPRQPMRRGLRMFPGGHMGHGPPPLGPPMCRPPQPPPFVNRKTTEKYRRSKNNNTNGEKKSADESKKEKSTPSNKESSETEKPWVNEAIIAEILLKHKLQQTARRSRGTKDWNAYREQRNKVTAMLRAAKLDWVAAKKAQEAKDGADESSPPGSSSSSSLVSQDSENMDADQDESEQASNEVAVLNGAEADEEAGEDTKPAITEVVNEEGIVDGISGDTSPGAAME